MTADDNLYTGEVAAIDYIVVAKGTDIGVGNNAGSTEDEAGNGMGENGEGATDSEKSLEAQGVSHGMLASPVAIALGVIIGVLVISILVFVIKIKSSTRKKRRSE